MAEPMPATNEVPLANGASMRTPNPPWSNPMPSPKLMPLSGDQLRAWP